MWQFPFVLWYSIVLGNFVAVIHDTQNALYHRSLVCYKHIKHWVLFACQRIKAYLYCIWNESLWNILSFNIKSVLVLSIELTIHKVMRWASSVLPCCHCIKSVIDGHLSHVICLYTIWIRRAWRVKWQLANVDRS